MKKQKVVTIKSSLVEVPNILKDAAKKAILDKLRFGLEPYVEYKIVHHNDTFDIYAEIQILEDTEE